MAARNVGAVVANVQGGIEIEVIWAVQVVGDTVGAFVKPTGVNRHKY